MKKITTLATLFLVLPLSSYAMWRPNSFLIFYRTMATWSCKEQNRYNRISNEIEYLRKKLAMTPERGKKQKQQIKKLWDLYDRRSILEEKLRE